MTKHKARINDWLWVGDCYSCPDDGHEIAIHIYRTDTGEKQERCCVYPANRRNLRFDYKDARLLKESHLSELDSIVALLKDRIRPTLVHCHAGMCRSPTVAIYLLIFVLGMNPYDARHLVTKAIYDERDGLVCNVEYVPFKQIVELWEQSGYSDSSRDSN